MFRIRSTTDKDILRSLRNLSEPDWEWPDLIELPPWKLPDGSHPESRKINEILQQSLNFQRSTAPPSFNRYIEANNCFGTTGLMYHYLRSFISSLGDTGESDIKFVFGIFELDDYDEEDGIPHCWLRINEQIIDNSFLYDEHPSVIHWGLGTRQLERYNSTEDIMTTSMDIYIGGNPGQVSASLKVYNTFSKADDLIEKYMTFQMNMASPIRAYDLLMRKYLYRRFKLDVEDLTEKWAKHCWNCNINSSSLKTCSACKIAKYCSKECQRAYRKIDKVLDQEWLRTMEFVSRP